MQEHIPTPLNSQPKPICLSSVPVINLQPWIDFTDRDSVATQVDAALSSVGFFLVTGHGVPSELRAEIRARAREFFALPEKVKSAYAVTVGGRGWLPPGVEANGYSEGTQTPPDLKESFAVGADVPVGDPVIDDYWFQPNVWPAEVPALQGAMCEYLVHMRRIANELLRVAAHGLVLAARRSGHDELVSSGEITDEFFTSHTGHATNTLNINWYPPLTHIGNPPPGAFRIGPHTDFGTLTVLDREPGTGGLQVWNHDSGWEDAPYNPEAFTINTGDLLARWSGNRWISNRHRVLPPDVTAPEEDLMSLVFFFEANHDTVVKPLQPPLGQPNSLETVVASEFLRCLLDAITVG